MNSFPQIATIWPACFCLLPGSWPLSLVLCTTMKEEGILVMHVGNYLIYGLCFFAVGGGFLALFQFMALVSYSCSSAVAKTYAFIKIIFITSQVILIIRCRHGHVFSKPKSILNGLLLFHTVITNVVLYITTFLESKKEFAIQHNSSRSIPLPISSTQLN